MSTKLNESAMQSELAGSAFFTPAPPGTTPPSPAPPPEPETGSRPATPVAAVQMGEPLTAPVVTDNRVRSSASAPTPQVVRTPVRSVTKRTITRYAFELYRDQVDTLQRYRVEELSMGETGSMSQMVRDALDAYIAEREGSQ